MTEGNHLKLTKLTREQKDARVGIKIRYKKKGNVNYGGKRRNPKVPDKYVEWRITCRKNKHNTTQQRSLNPKNRDRAGNYD